MEHRRGLHYEQEGARGWGSKKAVKSEREWEVERWEAELQEGFEEEKMSCRVQGSRREKGEKKRAGGLQQPVITLQSHGNFNKDSLSWPVKPESLSSLNPCTEMLRGVPQEPVISPTLIASSSLPQLPLLQPPCGLHLNVALHRRSPLISSSDLFWYRRSEGSGVAALHRGKLERVFFSFPP